MKFSNPKIFQFRKVLKILYFSNLVPCQIDQLEFFVLLERLNFCESVVGDVKLLQLFYAF